MNQVELLEEARNAEVLSKECIDTLLETMQYNSIHFINWAIEVFQILHTRIVRGDKITDEVSKVIYDEESLKEFIQTNFSSYIFSQVFDDADKAQKVYFSLKSCENGYNLVMAPTPNEKTYTWISTLSLKFSLVYMIATNIVYVKNIKTSTYQPFISENGKYCKYDKEQGKLIEVE